MAISIRDDLAVIGAKSKVLFYARPGAGITVASNYVLYVNGEEVDLDHVVEIKIHADAVGIPRVTTVTIAGG